MHRRILALALLIAFGLPLVSTHTGARNTNSPARSVFSAANIPEPKDVLGFVPGDDRKLASWNQLLKYFEALDKASDRVKFEELGRSTMGVPFAMATISAPENLARLNEYKRIQDLLADPRRLGPPSVRKRKAADLIKRGKTIVLITCGIHSTEVGSYLSSMLIAHRLASSSEPEIQNILRNTIILLVPSLNPDGVDIVKDWYDKTLGTPYEGTSPPELYHKYTGHDNNRDWYALTQVETQITVDKIHNVWHPQIVHDIHQQGEYGSRLFLPPYMPPVEPNVPKQIVEGYTELGNWMAGEMRAQGFQGITTNSTYDAWSPSRAYSHYHGGVRMLSETASCKIATPITVKFDQLRGGEGYSAKKESATFGPVWRGGEWHLRDITNYMTTAAFLLLRHASEKREEWLSRFYEIGKEAVRPRKNNELWGFRINSASNWTSYYLEEILKRAGVEVIYTKRRAVGKNPRSLKLWAAQEAIVRMDQPYGGFAKALLEVQHYPDLRSSSGEPIQPYDVTAQTLPLLMNVQVQPLLRSVQYQSVDVERNQLMWGKRPYGAKVAIYKSHVPSMDEGWTRWAMLHDANFLYDGGLTIEEGGTLFPVEDKGIREGGLHSKFDTIVIPDQARAAILNGYRASTMPPEYTGGLGQEGVKALREFVEQGGTLVCLNRASDFAIQQFNLPLRDVVADVSEKEFFVPGSILRIELDTTHPIAQGMPRETIAWVEDSPVFEVIPGGAGILPAMSAKRETADKMSAVPASKVRVIARYPDDKNPLLSGWLLGESRIRGKAALVEVTMGQGRIILFGFRPQYRGQSLATYPLLFNAISGK
jgi:zinc carboxypeptidase